MFTMGYNALDINKIGKELILDTFSSCKQFKTCYKNAFYFTLMTKACWALMSYKEHLLLCVFGRNTRVEP